MNYFYSSIFVVVVVVVQADERLSGFAWSLASPTLVILPSFRPYPFICSTCYTRCGTALYFGASK